MSQSAAPPPQGFEGEAAATDGGDASANPTAGTPAEPREDFEQQPPMQQQQQQQQQQAQQHQQPVNFNPRESAYNPSRRVTIGGQQQQGPPPPGGAPPPNAAQYGYHHDAATSTAMDRRGSMASVNFNMDDFFNRRPSMGMDNMDTLFGRRGSMDSTSAALDAAILDLQRRRFSVVDGGTGGHHAFPPPAGGPPGLDTSFSSQHHVPSAPPQPTPGANGAAAAGQLSARQQQLQQEQRELERRQKELEVQRQQLIASMQERNHPSAVQVAQRSPYAGPPFPPTTSGSLGLGSVGSHGSHGSGAATSASAAALYHSHRGSMGLASMNSASGHGPTPNPTGSGSQKWWICQICNSKAFSSHEEAMTHERVCSMAGAPGMGAAGGMPGGYGAGPNFNLDYSQRSVLSDSLHVGRNFSLGMDSSAGASYNNPEMSNGPFALMDKPQPLAMESDKDWLTPLHCFVRRHCVEVFTATQDDVATPSKGKRKPIHVGQVGIRCPHCHTPQDNTKARERGSVYYPTTISSIYNATMNLLQRHLHNCTAVPDDIMRRYETLKADDARSGTSKRYWVESSLSLGLVDTSNGIRFSALQPPPLPQLTRSQESSGFHAARRNSNEFFSTHSNAMAEISETSKKVEEGSERTHVTASSGGVANNNAKNTRSGGLDGTDASRGQGGMGGGPGGDSSGVNKTEQDMASSAPLVTAEDQPYSTAFSYHLLSQMQPCLFTEADRLGKRKGLPPGFPGLACRHCFGGYGSGRFFPSSIKTLSDTSKTLNVLHNHMMRCRKCPAEVRESLEKLRGSHDDERAKMKFGSQKAFFARIWERLHGKGASPALKRKPVGPPPPQAPPPHMMMDPYAGMRGMGGLGGPPPPHHPHHYAMSMSARGSMGGGSMGGGSAGSHRLPPQSAMDALASAAGNPKRQKMV